jgi:hypothetical protein
MQQRRFTTGLLVSMTLAIAGTNFSAFANGLAGAYIDPNYLTASSWQDATAPGYYPLLSPWGVVSHWIHPWRAYQTTVPASQFIQGVGVNYNCNGLDADRTAKMLAIHGIKRVRIDVGWGNLDYATEKSIIATQPWIGEELAAAKNHNLRPLIILNSNQGVPCPYTQSPPSAHSVVTIAPQNATTVQLDNTNGITIGYSGFSNVSTYTMNEVLITGIDPTTNTVTLSKPLPAAIPAGPVAINTFKYRPFDGPDDPYYDAAEQQATINGWNTYVKAIANIAANAMGTTVGSPDMGFDMEIWNETSFGSQFLGLSWYYGLAPSASTAIYVAENIVNGTANTAAANPDQFNGVVIEDGFTNEDPIGAAVDQPARIGALGKHLYSQQRSYPHDQGGSYMLNALLQLEFPAPFPFVPQYTEYMPEYWATFLDSPSPIQDLCPFTTRDGGAGKYHGENSRTINGQVVPCTVFVTETGIQPAYVNVTDPAAAMQLKAKGDSRLLAFYLNKGASQVDLFAASGQGDQDFQLFSQSFINYIQMYSDYPDETYASPALHLIGKMVTQMENGLDPSINSSNTRALTVTDISPFGNYYQFAGDGTTAHPSGYDQERFAFLPFQVNAHKFVIAYYVMTANIANPMSAQEAFNINIQGINGIGATVTAYDPLNDRAVPVSTNPGTANSVNVSLATLDYPYLLIIQEAN